MMWIPVPEKFCMSARLYKVSARRDLRSQNNKLMKEVAVAKFVRCLLLESQVRLQYFEISIYMDYFQN